MTRIVAGTAGGRTLHVPAKGTRPTSDRVREALFSRLEHLDALEGARVLDLFAGSGALGLEAASRGAGEVVLVESSRVAADVCRRNAEALGLRGVKVLLDRVQPFLERLDRPGFPGHGPAEPVDLVLVDPPYDLPEADLAAVLQALVPHLSAHAVVVVERSVRTPEPVWPGAAAGGGTSSGLVRTDQRRYGETVVWFASPRDPAAPDGASGPADVAEP